MTGYLGMVWRRLHGSTADGVPRWAVNAAYLVPLCTLPSGVWRILDVTFGVSLVAPGALPDGGRGMLPDWLPSGVYVVLLSVFSEALAFLTVGLVSRWGEVVPGWVPLMGGRGVPVAAAVLPAGAGALALTVLGGLFTVSLALGRKITGQRLAGPGLPSGWFQHLVFDVAYLPLLAWGPLLALVTVAYYRRRCARPPSPRAGLSNLRCNSSERG
jgi:hypothetical protein